MAQPGLLRAQRPRVGRPTNQLVLPGTSGNYASAPDSTALSITGDIDVRVRAALDDWSPSAVQNLVAKWNGSINQRTWVLYVATNGTLHFQQSTNGSASASDQPSSVSAGITDGTPKWCRCTYRNSDGRVQFFTGDTGSTWTQLGTDRTSLVVGTAMFDSTALLEVGSQNAGTVQFAAGKFYRVQIYNNILDDGTGLVFDADFTKVRRQADRLPATLREDSTNKATVTMNGSAWNWLVAS